jgi:hypothetical protein
MVAFAGRKYAARSFPTFVGNSSYVVTGFTLVCILLSLWNRVPRVSEISLIIESAPVKKAEKF